MGFSHWNGPDGDSSWDTLVLGGEVIPGIATVDVDMGSGLDIQKPTGKNGAKVRDKGDPVARVNITIQIESQEELDELHSKVPVIRQKGLKGTHQPLKIDHPNTAFWGIDTLQVGRIHAPPPNAKDGWTIEIYAQQWVAEAKPVAKQKEKPEDDASAWAPFVDDTMRKDAPHQSATPLTNMF
jgi:hypothetical protein